MYCRWSFPGSPVARTFICLFAVDVARLRRLPCFARSFLQLVGPVPAPHASNPMMPCWQRTPESGTRDRSAGMSRTATSARSSELRQSPTPVDEFVWRWGSSRVCCSSRSNPRPVGENSHPSNQTGCTNARGE